MTEKGAVRKCTYTRKVLTSRRGKGERGNLLSHRVSGKNTVRKISKEGNLS